MKENFEVQGRCRNAKMTTWPLVSSMIWEIHQLLPTIGWGQPCPQWEKRWHNIISEARHKWWCMLEIWSCMGIVTHYWCYTYGKKPPHTHTFPMLHSVLWSAIKNLSHVPIHLQPSTWAADKIKLIFIGKLINRWQQGLRKNTGGKSFSLVIKTCLQKTGGGEAWPLDIPERELVRWVQPKQKLIISWHLKGEDICYGVRCYEPTSHALDVHVDECVVRHNLSSTDQRDQIINGTQIKWQSKREH